jgi:hypothetical protein
MQGSYGEIIQWSYWRDRPCAANNKGDNNVLCQCISLTGEMNGYCGDGTQDEKQEQSGVDLTW